MHLCDTGAATPGVLLHGFPTQFTRYKQRRGIRGVEQKEGRLIISTQTLFGAPEAPQYARAPLEENHTAYLSVRWRHEICMAQQQDMLYRVIWKLCSLTLWYETYCIKYAHIHPVYRQALESACTRALSQRQVGSLDQLESCKQGVRLENLEKDTSIRY